MNKEASSLMRRLAREHRRMRASLPIVKQIGQATSKLRKRLNELSYQIYFHHNPFVRGPAKLAHAWVMNEALGEVPDAAMTEFARHITKSGWNDLKTGLKQWASHPRMVHKHASLVASSMDGINKEAESHLKAMRMLFNMEKGVGKMMRKQASNPLEALEKEAFLSAATRKAIPTEEFADPKNRKYPIHDKKHADAAAAYFARAKNQAKYSEAERAAIWKRIRAAQKRYGENPAEKAASSPLEALAKEAAPLQLPAHAGPPVRPPKKPLLLALGIGGSAVGTGALGAYLWHRRKKEK